jgi:DNA-directed RNA polymerase subunit RPC12/RpoP
MEQNINIGKNGGIKCDFCDWKDETITEEEIINWIDKQCPNCNSVVLTEQQYTDYKSFIDLVSMINSFSEADLNNMADFINKGGDINENEHLERLKELVSGMNINISEDDLVEINKCLDKENNEINFDVSFENGINIKNKKM